MAILNLKTLISIKVYNSEVSSRFYIDPARPKWLWRKARPARVNSIYESFLSIEEFQKKHKVKYNCNALSTEVLIKPSCELHFGAVKETFYFNTIEEAFKFRDSIKFENVLDTTNYPENWSNVN